MRKIPFRWLLPLSLSAFALGIVSALSGGPDWLAAGWFGVHLVFFMHGAYRGLRWILVGKEDEQP